jgi:hypothetical protein
MYSRRCYRFLQLMFGVVLLAPLGCAHVDVLAWARGIPEANEKNPVFNIVSVWEPSEGRNVNGMPARGFAGQLFFFTRLSATPVKVKGDVRVYVFDDQGTVDTQAKPIHQFDFLGDAWTAHLQDSTLGPSYNVFIPYTGEVTWLANCQIRLRLTTELGDVIYSDTVDVSLPGTPRPRPADATSLAGSPDAGTSDGHQVRQHLAAQVNPQANTIQLGATMRHKMIRPSLASNHAAAPALPQMSMRAQTSIPAQMPVAAHVSAAQPVAKRFRLSTTPSPPPATYGTSATTFAAAQPVLPRPSVTGGVAQFDRFGAVPGNWPQVGRPVVPTTVGRYPFAAATQTFNQPPAYQPRQHQANQLQSVGFQPVVYQVEANGRSGTGANYTGYQNTGHHNTGHQNTVPNNVVPTNPVQGGGGGARSVRGPTSATHPLGLQTVVGHPLADAIQ